MGLGPVDYVALMVVAFLTVGALLGASVLCPAYVPTAIDITLTLLPIQTRQQVSKQFSVKEFSNGNLIRGGFW